MINVEVNVQEPGWHLYISEAEQFVCEVMLACVHGRGGVFGVSVLLTDDFNMRDMNMKYRNLDKPTNVLSFPYSSDFGSNFLGDIAVGLGIVLKEAGNYRIPMEKYAARILVHGCMHLLGYDHQNDEEEREMQVEERETMRKLGYIPYF